MERYSRQLTHPGFLPEHQEKLKNSTILVAGIGGLGGSVVWSLAAAGIGKLVLVHAGNLDEPDLNRQTLMTSDWVGKPRVDKARETIHRFNPDTEIITHDLWINRENFPGLLHGVDFVIDARHNFPERRIINESCVKAGVPYIEAAMNGMEGYLFGINPGNSACLDCVFPEDPVWDPFGFSVFGAVAAVTGSMAALEAIKYVSGYLPDIFGKITYLDFTGLVSRQYRLRKDSACKTCKGGI